MNFRTFLILFAGICLGILAGAGVLQPKEAQYALVEVERVLEPPGIIAGSATSSALVTRIIDGDTFEIAGGEHVRLIGIDTPEIGRNGKRSECFADEASAYAGDRMLGRTVLLTADAQDRDKYGRLLRFAEIEGVNINIAMVESGYATRIYIPPNSAYQNELRLAEARAKLSGRGMWSACD